MSNNGLTVDNVAAVERLMNSCRASGAKGFKGKLTVGEDVVWELEMLFERTPEKPATRRRPEDE
jgi:hypothetical protein